MDEQRPAIKGPMIKKTDLFTRIRHLPLKFRGWLARVKAAYLDNKLGIDVRGRGPRTGENPEGKRFQHPSHYGRLEKMMRFLRPSGEDVFVDLGCGEGRVVFFAATHPFKKIIGIEIDKEPYDSALQNSEKLKFRGAPIELIHSDAVDFDPREGTAFFMCSPFGATVLKKVLSNIKDSLSTNPRKIRIVYYGSQYKELLEKEDWLRLAGKIGDETCLVWENVAPGEKPAETKRRLIPGEKR